MSDVFDIFGVEDAGNPQLPYHRIGFPRNPFREAVGDALGDPGPFYTGHIDEQLKEIQRWIRDVHFVGNRQPLSLVGNIGAGKTRILHHLKRRLSVMPIKEKVACELLLLSDTGYGRASVGGMLISALERVQIPWADTPKEERASTIPIVRAICHAKYSMPAPSGQLASALLRASIEPNVKNKDMMAMAISKWLQRAPLTVAETNLIGIHRRLDWEGELIRIIGELLRSAKAAGILSTLFLFVDQLEDLFRPTFSELRRSRILTDLRGVVDEIDQGMPVGLILSWTPEFSVRAAMSTLNKDEVEKEFRNKYEALFSRMQRRRVVLPLLSRDYAEPFANEWIKALKDIEGFEKDKQPDTHEIVTKAWLNLKNQQRLFPGGGGTATPRDLLTALADIVDEEATY